MMMPGCRFTVDDMILGDTNELITQGTTMLTARDMKNATGPENIASTPTTTPAMTGPRYGTIEKRPIRMPSTIANGRPAIM